MKQAIWYDFGVEKGSNIKPDEPEFKVGDYVAHTDSSIGMVIGFNGSHSIPNTKQTVDVYWGVNTLYAPKIGFHSKDKLKLWTLEDASDDELVIQMYYDKHIPVGFGVQKAKSLKGNIYENGSIAPYIGQTPAQLGLEK